MSASLTRRSLPLSGGDGEIGHMSKRYRLWILIACVAAVYAAIYVAAGGLDFDARKDEVHFWPTSLQFSQRWVPSIEQLRGYDELNAPLPFGVFGGVERAFGGGIRTGRAVNLVASLLIVLGCVLAARDAPSRAARAVAALMIFPYFFACATHLYTDMLAALLVFAGIAAYRRGWGAASAIAFVLAIASRQYMVAFPAAIAAYELIQFLRQRRRGPSAGAVQPARPGEATAKTRLVMAAYSLLACASLGLWYALWGGFAPPAALAHQPVETAGVLRLLPHNALYFLACVGAYYVIPETLLFWRQRREQLAFRPALLIVAAVLAGLFVLFPPLRNPPSYGIATMGYLDKAFCAAAGDGVRMVGFYALALLACVRFSRFRIESVLVLANAALMMKAHIAWDKYALPLLAALWLLRAMDGRASARGE